MRILLDLFCGAGGAARGYQEAGFYVVGVDNKPQPRYAGDEFILGDALAFLENGSSKGFDVIHASPPCQAYSNLSRRGLGQESHPKLIEPTRRLLQIYGLPYVIENVVGAPLIDPIQLCGSSFRLRVRRHRLFESNVPLKGKNCSHDWQNSHPIYDVYQHGRWIKTGVAYVFGSGGRKANEHWKEAMGIPWMTSREIVEAIPPAYTKWIGEQLLCTPVVK